MSKTFVVLGATGAQGKSVIAAVAKYNAEHTDSAFKIRGVARRVDSDVAKQLLSEYGSQLELIAGDMTKPGGLDQAFAGATHLFALTQFWDPQSMGKEIEIGGYIADSAKKSGIQYVWMSSLADVETVSGGKLHVPHFTDKKRVEEKLQQAGLKVIGVGPAFYYSNWTTLFAPKSVGNNVFEWTLPLKADTLLSAFAVEDTGLIVGATLKNTDEFVGKYIPIAGDHITVQKYLDTIAHGLGGTAKLVSVPFEQFAKFGFPGAEEVAHMCEWFNQYGYFGPNADLEWARKLAPQLQRFEDWFAKNKNLFKAQ